MKSENQVQTVKAPGGFSADTLLLAVLLILALPSRGSKGPHHESLPGLGSFLTAALSFFSSLQVSRAATPSLLPPLNSLFLRQECLGHFQCSKHWLPLTAKFMPYWPLGRQLKILPLPTGNRHIPAVAFHNHLPCLQGLTENASWHGGGSRLSRKTVFMAKLFKGQAELPMTACRRPPPLLMACPASTVYPQRWRF